MTVGIQNIVVSEEKNYSPNENPNNIIKLLIFIIFCLLVIAAPHINGRI